MFWRSGIKESNFVGVFATIMPNITINEIEYETNKLRGEPAAIRDAGEVRSDGGDVRGLA